MVFGSPIQKMVNCSLEKFLDLLEDPSGGFGIIVAIASTFGMAPKGKKTYSALKEMMMIAMGWQH